MAKNLYELVELIFEGKYKKHDDEEQQEEDENSEKSITKTQRNEERNSGENLTKKRGYTQPKRNPDDEWRRHTHVSWDDGKTGVK